VKCARHVLAGKAGDQVGGGAAFNQPGDAIVLLGSLQPGGFAGSDYAKVVNTVVGGRPTVVDLDADAPLAAVLVEGGAGARFASWDRRLCWSWVRVVLVLVVLGPGASARPLPRASRPS
jgi:hypothetical protein